MIQTPDGGTKLSKGSYESLTMNGKEVYKFATREVPRVINEALDAADMTVEEVDWLLLHQVSCFTRNNAVLDYHLTNLFMNEN